MDRMAEIINGEQSSGSDNQHNRKPSRKCKRKTKQKADKSDKDNANFTGSSSDSDSVSEDNDRDCVEIANIEVCFHLTLNHILFPELFSKLADSLPSKTIPSRRNRKSQGKKPAQKWKRVVDTLEANYYSQAVLTSKSKSGNLVTRKTVYFELQIKLHQENSKFS